MEGIEVISGESRRMTTQQENAKMFQGEEDIKRALSNKE